MFVYHISSIRYIFQDILLFLLHSIESSTELVKMIQYSLHFLRYFIIFAIFCSDQY
jgi:hypothetical protein